ncbi:MAG TPA: RNA polymerase sigma factor [Pyrinomonadaceae bacterium]|nr:RNA polymerase sigma factor [Pyrinomonadaceae bacterium]
MAGSQLAQKIRPEKTEERLLVEAAQRDRAQFVALYEKYFEVVYAYVARRLRDRSATEDVTSEVFRRALQSLPKFKWTGAPFGAWLLRIAANVIADRAKRRAREELNVAPVSDQSKLRPQETDLEQSERQAHLFRLIGELAEDQRRVVMLRFAEEKTIGEIARDLGRSEGAIKQLQLRALKNLRAKLEAK